MTRAASAVTPISATLNASVNPNGGEVSECKFEYGTTTSYGSSAPCVPPPGAGTSPGAVSAAVTTPTPHTTHHFPISPHHPGGTRQSPDHGFQTLPNPPAPLT